MKENLEHLIRKNEKNVKFNVRFLLHQVKNKETGFGHQIINKNHKIDNYYKEINSIISFIYYLYSY